MKIFFGLQARLGDVLCGIPAYRALRKKYPDSHITWRVHKNWEPVVPRDVDEIQISEINPFGGPFKGIEGYDHVFNVQAMWRHDEWLRANDNMINVIAKWCDVELEDPKIEVEIEDKDYDEARKLDLPEKFVTVCSSPHYSANQEWPLEQKKSIVRGLVRDNHKVVTVGGADGEVLPGAKVGHGISLKGSLALISLSNGYIGADCGSSWLACAAYHVPKVIIIEDWLKGRVSYRKSIGNICDDVYLRNWDTNRVLNKLYKLQSES